MEANGYVIARGSKNERRQARDVAIRMSAWAVHDA
jgi:hypothetical protein